MNDAVELSRLRTLARVMDDAVRIPGTNIRVGLDAVLGLVPGLGDAAGGVTTAYTLLAAQRLGAPKVVLLRMLWNLIVDSAFGAIPLLGDVFDVAYRANRRNVELVERYAAAPATTERSSMAFVMLLIVLVFLVIGASIAGAILLARWIISALA